jgi:anti-sigma28 factor (negative regulator of flagellin synthesis)
MNVNEPSQSSFGSSAATARAHEAPSASAPDAHLAELVRSLRSLAADSPERQARIEGLMRAYADGTLRVDQEATASAIIDDAVRSRLTLR